MMKTVSFFVLFLGINRSIAQWNTNDYLKREHSLAKPYQGAGMSIPFWDFTGNTMVTQDYIRLTADRQSSQGGLWNSVPCTIRNWEVQIHFKVHGKAKELFGDGFAFWYTKDRMQLGNVFGSKDNFLGLAVLADTYNNHNGPHNHGHPYISAMVNNGTMNYDHDRDGTHTEVAGCESQFKISNHDTHLNIRYENDVLTVTTDIDGKNSWSECFKVEGVQLPTGYYFGFSAATGDLSGYLINFFFMKVFFWNNGLNHVEDPEPSMSGFKLFMIILCSIIGLVVLGLVGFMLYQKQQETSRKRFY
ncbi:VIP36-like protein [Nymphon striatum]|nr:VIP36-like protein [Nymphon striatum]